MHGDAGAAAAAPMPSMFEQGQVLLMQLQHLGHALRQLYPEHGTLLRTVMTSMQLVRECVNDDLADEFGCSTTMVNKTSAYVSKVIQRCRDEAAISCPDEAAVRTARSTLLAQEVEAIEELASTPFSLQAPARNTLRELVKHLRCQEETRSFHVQLRQCQLKLSSSYDMSTFAYGSTPLFTWMKLLKTPLLVDCIARIKKTQDAAACTVFGASTGSLVFFTALICDIRVQGFEILPFLVDVATASQRRFQLDQRVAFHCQDMLLAGLEQVQLLVLTSQCWEAGLVQAVTAKLEGELPPDALVLDYTSALSGSDEFDLMQSIVGAVSWNKCHTFHVYRKKRRAEHLD